MPPLGRSVKEFQSRASIRCIAKAIYPLALAVDFQRQDTNGSDARGTRIAELLRIARMGRVRIGVSAFRGAYGTHRKKTQNKPRQGDPRQRYCSFP